MSFSTASFTKKLASLQETQDSIVTISQWVLFHHRHSDEIAKLWASYTVLKGQLLAKKLSLLYLCNDVVQQAKHKKKAEFLVAFSSVLPEVLNAVYAALDHLIKAKVDRLINVWEQRNVFQNTDIAGFRKAVDLSKNNKLLEKASEPAAPPRSANSVLVALDLTQLNTLYLHMNQLIDILQANLTQVGIQSKTYLPQNPSASDNLPSPKVYISKLNVLDRLCNISKDNIAQIKKDRLEILRVLETLKTLVSEGLATDDSKISIIDGKLERLRSSRDELKSIVAENGDEPDPTTADEEEPSPAYNDEEDAPKVDDDDDIVPTYEDSDEEDSPPPKKQKLATPPLATPTPSGDSTPSQKKSVAFSENIEIKEYNREDNTQVIKIVKSDDDSLEMDDVDEPVIPNDFEKHHKDDLELKHDHEGAVSYELDPEQNDDDDDGYDPSSGVDDENDQGNSTVLDLLSKLT